MKLFFCFAQPASVARCVITLKKRGVMCIVYSVRFIKNYPNIKGCVPFTEALSS